MNTTSSGSYIRDLIPAYFKFTPKVRQAYREDFPNEPAPSNQTISRVINDECISSKYWPYVERVVRPLNPEKYDERLSLLLHNTAA